jgi:hypothetical protein
VVMCWSTGTKRRSLVKLRTEMFKFGEEEITCTFNQSETCFEQCTSSSFTERDGIDYVIRVNEAGWL